MKRARKTTLAVSVLLTGALLLTACAPKAPDPTPTETDPPTQAATQPPTTQPAMTAPNLRLNPGQVMNEFFDAGNAIVMTLCFADGSSYGPYSLLSMDTNLLGVWNGLTEVQEPDVSASGEWLVLESVDGAIRLTVYQGDTDIVLYEKYGERCYYQGVGKERSLRMIFDTAENAAAGRIAFSSGTSGEDLLKEYATTAYPQHLEKRAPGSAYQFSDYAALDWNIASTHGNALSGTISFAAIPSRGFSPMADWLEMAEGTGEYEGWTIFTKEVALEKQDDGLWYEISRRDYGVAYLCDYDLKDSAQVDTNDPMVQEALTYLAQAEEMFTQCQEAKDPATSIRELSELFLRCTTAAAVSGNTDFDWTILCTEDALSRTGMRSLLKWQVNALFADGFLHGNLDEDIAFQQIRIEDGRAMAILREIQIYFIQEDGLWRICDVLEPFAGT